MYARYLRKIKNAKEVVEKESNLEVLKANSGKLVGRTLSLMYDFNRERIPKFFEPYPTLCYNNGQLTD